VLDLCAPDGATGNAPRVEPGVEAFLRTIGLQPLRELGERKSSTNGFLIFLSMNTPPPAPLGESV
jgi:hypothetical protein